MSIYFDTRVTLVAMRGRAASPSDLSTSARQWPCFHFYITDLASSHPACLVCDAWQDVLQLYPAHQPFPWLVTYPSISFRIWHRCYLLPSLLAIHLPTSNPPMLPTFPFCLPCHLSYPRIIDHSLPGFSLLHDIASSSCLAMAAKGAKKAQALSNRTPLISSFNQLSRSCGLT